MKKSLILVLCTCMLLATVGCGGQSGNAPTPNVGTNEPVVETPKEQDNFSLPGTDVFNGERFNEMIWGYYEADCYDYTGSHEDSAVFLTDMKYVTVETELAEYQLSALPLSIQAGKYAHFMDTFMYEGEYYEPYTEQGKSMFRKAYIAEKGDMTEEQFQKIEAMMELNVVSMYLAQENGASFSVMMAYEVQNNSIILYDVMVDEEYNITIADEPFIKYYFLLDGGKLSLMYDNVQRDYMASGYKTTDSNFNCSGYALNATNQYADLVGFSCYSYSQGDIAVYVELSGGESPVDPVMEMDTTTGDFSISWQKRWTEVEGRTTDVDDPRTISGKFIPCTNYGFTEYCGFFLIIDGTCYRYLMSEKEYEERLYSNILGDVSMDDVGFNVLEELNATKYSILEELKKALDAAGITATIDTASGQVTLESNFLFATNSAEISEEGKDYLNRFIEAYTSVVLGDTYGGYISNIVIEGHTDTSGSYAMNQTLSEDRANAVANHCVTQSTMLTDIIRTKGCSYDYPVYNDDGTVNMDKSRRVTFSFVFATTE